MIFTPAAAFLIALCDTLVPRRQAHSRDTTSPLAGQGCHKAASCGHRLAMEIGATLLGRAPLLVSHIESGQLDSLRDAAHLPPRLYLVAGAQVVSAGDVGVHI